MNQPRGARGTLGGLSFLPFPVLPVLPVVGCGANICGFDIDPLNHAFQHFVIPRVTSKSTFQSTFKGEEPMKSRTSATLIIVAVVCICALIAGAQTKPNLSGVWKMNAQKSKFANGGPDNILIKIDHKEPAFVEDWSMSTPNGDRSFQAKYTTDGKETEQEVMGRT